MGDWIALGNLKAAVAPNDASFNPSIYITDAAGVTRVFNFLEGAQFHTMGSEAMIRGDGLAGRERSQTCS
jgi:hypothetical protein